MSPRIDSDYEGLWFLPTGSKRTDLNGPAQVFEAIRLGYDTLKPISFEVGHNGICGVAAGDEGPHMRIHLSKLLQSLLSPHPSRDGQIQDDGIEGSSLL